MKNNIDFIYEYSDLNLFQTRVKILTGVYADIILEFGGSMLAQMGSENTFTFEYTLYQLPKQFDHAKLRANPAFNEFLAYLLVDIVDSRNNDLQEKIKLEEAASSDGKIGSAIEIDDKWYPNGHPKLMDKSQPKTSLGDF
jgi:hypothetical protein